MGASLVIRLWEALVVAAAATGAPGELRQLAEGPVLGDCYEGVCEFKGLPYAAAPLHDLRWRPPQAPKSWPAVRSARQFEKNCMQVKGRSIVGSEDCLYLNVWSPQQCATSNCTVMLWIHGGSYVTGGTKDMFNGTRLAKDFGVVIVTVNYRLGILGFAGAEVLRSRDPRNSTGNYGIQDQRAAMEWVQRNIAVFGGNSSDVVLFGESAGAGSIAVHLTSPLSWPLYRRVIMQSGAFSYWNAQPMEDAQQQFQHLLDATKCDAVDCLLGKAADELTGLATVELNPEPLPEDWKAFGTFFSPTVDGVQLTQLPWDLLREGKFNQHVEVLLGFNKDEGTVLGSCEGLPKCEMLHKGSQMTESDFKKLMTTDLFNITESKLPEILQAYVPDLKENAQHDWYWIATEIYGDYSIACPSLRAADHIANITKETYLYMFAHTPQGAAPKWAGIFGKNGTVGATHAAELGFVWMGGDGWNASVEAAEGGWKLQKDEWLLAETVATYWTNFAKSGSPNVPDNGTSLTIPWSPWSTAGSAGSALEFSGVAQRCTTSQLGSLRRRCEVLDALGPMVEGYTQTRRLSSKDESPLLI